MSDLLKSTEQPCDSSQAEAVSITQVLSPREADIGGVIVRRVFPTVGRKMVGPWVFFDEMGPVEFLPGPGLNVPPHPHIGLATVTYLFVGEILHRDSLGSVQSILPGDVNLMVAGRGIVHSERETPAAVQQSRTLHGLQLWLALPEEHETCEPSFTHIGGESIPSVEVGEVQVRVIMGEAYGVKSPVPTYSPTLYLEIFMREGQQLSLPRTEELGVYVVSGELQVGETLVPAHTMAILNEPAQVTITVTQATRLAVIGGTPLTKRHINWNFVSSSRERIATAREDWQAGRFPRVPGDEDEFVPLPK